MDYFAERTDAFEQSEHIPQDMAQHTQLYELRTKIKQGTFGKGTGLSIFKWSPKLMQL